MSAPKKTPQLRELALDNPLFVHRYNPVSPLHEYLAHAPGGPSDANIRRLKVVIEGDWSDPHYKPPAGVPTYPYVAGAVVQDQYWRLAAVNKRSVAQQRKLPLTRYQQQQQARYDEALSLQNKLEEDRLLLRRLRVDADWQRGMFLAVTPVVAKHDNEQLARFGPTRCFVDHFDLRCTVDGRYENFDPSLLRDRYRTMLDEYAQQCGPIVVNLFRDSLTNHPLTGDPDYQCRAANFNWLCDLGLHGILVENPRERDGELLRQYADALEVWLIFDDGGPNWQADACDFVRRFKLNRDDVFLYFRGQRP